MSSFETEFKVVLKKCFLYVDRIMLNPDVIGHLTGFWKRNPDKFVYYHLYIYIYIVIYILQVHAGLFAPGGTHLHYSHWHQSVFGLKSQYKTCTPIPTVRTHGNCQCAEWQLHAKSYTILLAAITFMHYNYHFADHHSLKSIGLRLGAVLLKKFEFTNKDNFTMIGPYESLKKNFGYEEIYNRKPITPIPFDLRSYKRNYFFICFDLTRLAAMHVGESCINQISFEIDFEEDTSNTLSFVALSQDKCGLQIKPNLETNLVIVA